MTTKAAAPVNWCLRRLFPSGNWNYTLPNVVFFPKALVAELVDAQHSGCCARTGVEVRVLSRAPWALAGSWS